MAGRFSDHRDPQAEQDIRYGRDAWRGDPPETPRAASETGYTGRGFTGGYGQNGSDPGTRISAYGDRVYRGGADGGHRMEHDPGYRGLGPKGYKRSDPRISEDVHDRLTEDAHIDASEIVVEVKDGEVTLSGSVRDRRAKHHAEAIIEHIAGVGHVQNNLRAESNLGQGLAPQGENTILRAQAEGET